LVVLVEGRSHVTSTLADSPHGAVQAFLETPVLNTLLAKLQDWPKDFSIHDIYLFIPLDGLPNAYFCGLGANGKYIGINIFHTVRNSLKSQRYCGILPKIVHLRNDSRSI